MPEPTKIVATKPTGMEIDSFSDKDRMTRMLQMANEFVKSGAFGGDVQNAHQAFVKIQAGTEIGLKPMQSMGAFYIVNGKMTMWGAALTQRLRDFGWKIDYLESTKVKCVVKISKGDEEYTETATPDDVKRDGAYRFAPKNKLRWHAIAQVVKFNVPEVLGGSVNYITEEIQGEVMREGTALPLAEAESVPEITLLLNDISKIDSLEKLNKLQTDDLPNWANNYSSEDLDKVAEVMKTRREELEKGGEAEASVSLEQPECAEPKPATEKTVIEGMLEDSGLAEKEPKTPITDIMEGKKTPKKKTVKKEVKLKVEEITEKKSLDEAADELFDDEKITKEDAEKFKKFFELKELDPAPWLGRCTVSHFHELTVEGAKELKRLIKMEIQ